MASKRSYPMQKGGDEGNVTKRTKTMDPYCWLCHEDDTSVMCNSCQRSYHGQCIGSKTVKEYQCEVCIREDLAKSNNDKWHNNTDYLNELLGHIVKRLFDSGEFNVLSYNYFDDKLPAGTNIVNAFDLRHIRNKVQFSEYQTPLEFLNDIRWIKHNVIASDNIGELPVAKRLEQFCKKEIYDIEMCVECFERSNTQTEWFTKVCNPPHLLVWARENGHHPYIPAKVIGINSKLAKKIDVRFFGNHDMVRVSMSDCYLFTKGNPKKVSDEKTVLALIHSTNEANIYIDNIEKKFQCQMMEADYKTPLDINKIGEQLMQMVPSLKLPADFQLKTKPIYLNPLKRRRAPISAKPIINVPSNVSTRVLKVVLENCDHLVKRYECVKPKPSDANEDNENDHENDESANDQSMNDGESDEEVELIINPDEDPLMTCEDSNQAARETQQNDDDLLLSTLGKRKPFFTRDSISHENTTRLISLQIEPVEISEQTTEEIVDDEMEIASNHSNTDSMDNNAQNDDFEAHIPEIVTVIIDTEETHEMIDNAVENNEEAAIITNQTPAFDFVVISEDQVNTSNNQKDDEMVSMPDIPIEDEELVEQCNEKATEGSAQGEPNDGDFNRKESQSCVQETHEVPQTDRLPSTSKMVLPSAQSTPLKSASQLGITKLNSGMPSEMVARMVPQSPYSLAQAVSQSTPQVGSQPTSQPVSQTVSKQVSQSASQSASQSTPQLASPPAVSQLVQSTSTDPSVQSIPPKRIENENIDTAMNALHELAQKNDEHAASLQLELKKKNVAYLDLKKQTEEALKRLKSHETITKELESQVELLAKNLTDKQIEMDNMKLKHAAELLKVINETKKKLWCRSCGCEMVERFHGLLVCSPQCFEILWKKERETSRQPSAESVVHSSGDQARNDVESLVADLLNDAPANGQKTRTQPNMEPTEAENLEDPDDSLANDLRDF